MFITRGGSTVALQQAQAGAFPAMMGAMHAPDAALRLRRRPRAWPTGAVLMVLQFIWAYYLLKVVIKTLAGGHAEDSRSDDEDEGGDDEPAVAKKKQ